MDQQTTLITVGVQDVARTRDFYVGKLGWTPIMALPEIIFLQVNHGMTLAFWSGDELAADLGLPPSSGPGSSMTLSQNLASPEEVEAVFAEFVAAGGTAVKQPQQAAFGGFHAAVADPDGLVWEIAFNPGLTVDGDGIVRIVEIT